MTKHIYDRVEKQPNGCWRWLGNHDAHGWGNATHRGKTMGVHRISWEIENGPIPKGVVISHECGVLDCINPEHLFATTRAERARLSVAKGRTPVGSRCTLAKLNEEKVLEMRQQHHAGVKRKALAAEYGVSYATVCLIVTGKLWKHVGGPLATTRKYVDYRYSAHTISS